ncbi:Ammonium transporter 1 [Nymphon striatum]|nr:Ammonium transporter 1 [Nymphon striatum]
MTFAVITPALMVGAFVERIKFGAVMMISALWLLIVYAPVTHWVWGGGWLAEMGVIDFAGGIVVHVTAGVSALVIAIMLGSRKGFPEKILPPHAPWMVMVGASLLWVGWFGFNAGSAVAADQNAGMAILVTHLSAATASIVWLVIEKMKYGKPSLVGLVTGTIAGLATITPASGSVGPLGGVLLGLVGGLICYFAVDLVRHKMKIDDSLDVLAVHGVGGATGTLLVAFLAGFGDGGCRPCGWRVRIKPIHGVRWNDRSAKSKAMAGQKGHTEIYPWNRICHPLCAKDQNRNSRQKRYCMSKAVETIREAAGQGKIGDDAFEDDGFPVSSFEDLDNPVNWEIAVYMETDLAEATNKRMLALARENGIDVSFNREDIPDIDWVAETLRDLIAVRAGRFIVHGSHESHVPKPHEIPVLINAGLAFGTGHHGTTAGCLDMLTRVCKRKQFHNVLDLGTGSGVLGNCCSKSHALFRVGN